MDMGYADYGGGPAGACGTAVTTTVGRPPPQPGDVSVADLTGPQDGDAGRGGHADRRPQAAFRLASGEQVDGYTLNGTVAGPEIRAQQGDLVEVTLVNKDVPDGVTLHWHGIDVPNAEDGVAGRDPGRGSRRAARTSTGSSPRTPGPTGTTPTRCPTSRCAAACSASSWSSRPSGAGRRPPDVRRGRAHLQRPAHHLRLDRDADASRPARRDQVRVRVVNTDNGPLRVWVTGAPYRVLAVDGRDVNEPTAVRGPCSWSSRPAAGPTSRSRPGRRRSGPAGRRWWRRRCCSRRRRRRPAPRRGRRRAARPAQRTGRPQPTSASTPSGPTGGSTTASGGGSASSTAGPGFWWSDQRPPLPRRTDVRRGRGRRRADDDQQQQRRRRTPCTCTGTMPSCSAGTASRRPAARGGSTR